MGLRDSFFYPNDVRSNTSIPTSLLTILRGHYQSLRPTQTGLMMNIDLSGLFSIAAIPNHS